ncbi:hypothetical protein [Candidatus Nitrosotalea bavarica]|uniref:hypothetical protein n=1 Tax=Candidatus Nitrosotalea bavarica TaxID=1903277 RepID=UPI000C711FFF|nr:hypothetical protein [Candidatus Nitrosotalea bavarica]
MSIKMKKRGPIILITGTIMIILAASVAYSIIPQEQQGTNGDFFPSPESLFDNVSDKVTIDAGNVYIFSHTVNTAGVPLMWGVHIVDYTPNDNIGISISNIFGDKFGSFVEGDPIFIKSFDVSKADTYNFNVENKGKEPITVVMLFTENPEKSKALTDPNSTFVKNIIPLAEAGFLLIVGIIVVIAGIILSVMDWRKGKNQSSRYI